MSHAGRRRRHARVTTDGASPLDTRVRIRRMPTADSAQPSDVRATFLREATWHGSLDAADALLAAHPELAGADIHVAAVLGDEAAVRRCIASDPASVHAKSPPYAGDALSYLCLSRYLRLDPARSAAFVRTATALLDAGADANTGFWTTGKFPEHETALYGAAGVAHHGELTRLLLARGADPNDDEACYHSPESDQNDAMIALVETGRLTADNLSMMLIRKHDWHDYDGAKYLLEHGADPNGVPSRGWFPLHHALARSNGIEMFVLLMDHRANALVVNNGMTAVARAAREGRRDVLALFEQRGVPIDLQGVDALIAACARDQAAVIAAIAARDPARVRELIGMGGPLLARFVGNGNVQGVRHLLDLGVPIDAPFVEGDGYFGIPAGSLAIHVAAWRAQPEIVTLLLARGSPVDVADADGETPLALAVKACVDSYWMGRRSPDSVRALLEAGASVRGVAFPSGYGEVDDLLRAHGA